MKKKIIGLLLALLMTALIITAAYYFRNKSKPNESGSVSEMPVQPELKQKNAELYQFDDLSYRFVLLDIEVKNDDKFSIKDIKTSEGVSLDMLEKYKKEFSEHNYDWDKLKLSEIQKDHQLRIFVPVLDSNAEKITVYAKQDEKLSLEIKLNDPANKDSSHFLAGPAAPTPSPAPSPEVNPTENIYYSIFEIANTSLLRNVDGIETEYTQSSHARVFGVRMNQPEERTIVNAVLTVSTGEQIYAEDGSVYSVRYENLINQSIAAHPNAVLYFITLDPGQVIDINTGSLTVTYQNGETVIMNGAEISQ